MNAEYLQPKYQRFRFQNILFAFILIGTYVASYLIVVFPLLLTPLLFSSFIVISAIPALYFFQKWAGWKPSLVIVPLFILFIIFIESMGVLTGFPYGSFYYTDQLGFKVFGIIPWTVPLAFIPLLLGTFAIASRLTRKSWKIILISALLLVMYDLVFDPSLVLLNIWVWTRPGCYYGVPLTNYLGWFLTGLITSSLLIYLLEILVNSSLPISPMVASSLILSVGFWSGFALWQMLLIPFIVSIILLGIMVLVFIVPEKTNQNK